MIRPLRVLHAIRSDGFAGVEGYVARLAREQASMGMDVRVIGGAEAPMLRTLGDSLVAWRPARTVREVTRAIDEWRGHDILHAHMTAAELAGALAIRAQAPLVVTRHFAGPRGTGAAGKAAALLIRPRLAAQIAISRYVAERIEGSSTVVYPGVSSQPLSRAPRHRIVLVAQRQEQEKDTEDAIRAFAASGLAGEGWQLQLAGDGAERPRLERATAALLPSEAFSFLGHRSDLPQLLTRSGILIAPCRIEGFGLTVLEAMAAGLPIVAAAAGAHLETVGSVADAALFSDIDEAARLLRRLGTDDQERKSYGLALRDKQHSVFTLSAQAEATSAVYQRVLRR